MNLKISRSLHQKNHFASASFEIDQDFVAIQNETNESFLFALHRQQSKNSFSSSSFSSFKNNSLQINSFLADLYGFQEIQEYNCTIFSHLQIPTLSSGQIEPSSEKDWILVQENSQSIVNNFCSQILALCIGQEFVFWLESGQKIRFRPRRLLDSNGEEQKMGKVRENTLLEIVPLTAAECHSQMASIQLMQDLCGLEKITIELPNTEIICLEFVDFQVKNIHVSLETARKFKLFNGLVVKILKREQQQQQEEKEQKNSTFTPKKPKNFQIPTETSKQILQTHQKSNSPSLLLVCGMQKSGKSCICTELYLKEQYFLQIDSLKEIIELFPLLSSSFSSYPITFLLDDADLLWEENAQFFQYHLKVISNFMEKSTFIRMKMIFFWNNFHHHQVEKPRIFSLLFSSDEIPIKPPNFHQLMQFFEGNWELVERFYGCSWSLIAKQSKIPTSFPPNHHHQQLSLHESNVIGLEAIKEQLIEAVVWPLKYAKLYEKSGLSRKEGIVLWGPSGCGKSLLACKWLPNHPSLRGRISLFKVKGPALLAKFIGGSEEAVRRLFAEAAQRAPSLIVFEEFDSMAAPRGTDNSGATDRVVNQLLTELDGVRALEGVFVIACTSRLQAVDSALLRAGRLGMHIHVPFPGEEEKEALSLHFSQAFNLSKPLELPGQLVSSAAIESAALAVAMGEENTISSPMVVENETIGTNENFSESGFHAFK